MLGMLTKKRKKKTEVRYNSQDKAWRTSGAPSAAASLINRSRDRAGSTNQRVVAPRGIVGRLPRETAGGSEGETDG